MVDKATVCHDSGYFDQHAGSQCAQLGNQAFPELIMSLD